VFKKALQIATAFGILLAGYAGYGPAFALVARALTRSTPEGNIRFRVQASITHKRAIELARQKLGPGHWAAAEDLPIRLYNSDRGSYMYARDYDRNQDGKRVEFSPFAMIMVSADGRSVKTVTSDVAKIELDKPFDLAPKPGASGSLRVVHARLEGSVHIRDDKGTPGNPADDLRIGPLTWVEYDEPKLQINSDSDVSIEDDVYRITGNGLLIKLRPKDDGLVRPPGSPTGFEDAQTAYLFKNVHILISDVGAGGILPGTSNPPKAKPGTPTPLDLKCDGLMQIDFPRREPARTDRFVGPPASRGPTVAQFSRNVEVIRGKALPDLDRLNSDHLRLTLVPPEKPAAAPATAAAEPPPLSLDPLAAETNTAATAAADPTAPSPAAKGPMADLTLKEAVASGHNVRLVSAAQDIKVRCNELIFKKELTNKPGQPPEKPDTTYFRGDRTTGLLVEKVDRVSEGPDRGKVSAFTTIRAIDATIFDDHRGNDYAIIVAGGPGEMESGPGPGLDGPIERTAHWNDRLTIRPVTPAAPATDATSMAAAARTTPAPPVRKRVTLTGKPGFADIPARATLDGRDKLSTIDVWLKPKAPTTTPAKATPPPPGSGSGSGSGSYEIEHLVASRDVLLITPGRVVTARNDLQAAFVPVDAPASSAAKAPVAAAPAPVPISAPAPGDKVATPADPKEAPPARPVEPESRANADRVWARVFLRPVPAGQAAPAGARTAAAAPATPGLLGGGPGGARKAEIDEVRLRGTVVIHQDPGAGKARGTEIAGEAVDLFNQGGKGSKFIVYSADPKPDATPRPRAESTDPIAAADDDLFRPLAMVDSDDMVIRGRRIGLDQSTDQAWVEGNGSLTQLAARGLLSEKAPDAGKTAGEKRDKGQARKEPVRSAGAKPRDGTPKETTPMTIFFGDGMKFFGQSRDPTGRPAARAEFFKDVHAESDESTLDCQDVMRTYFDRTIKLVRPPAAPAQGQTPAQAPTQAQTETGPKEPEPKAELARIDCTRKVVVVNTKRDPDSKSITQRQRILGEFLTYERLTGKFRVPGEGTVYLYELEGQTSKLTPADSRAGPLGTAPPSPPRRVSPTSGPGPDTPRPVRRGTDVVGRTDVRNPADPDADRGPARKGRRPAARPLPPLVLTQVHFTTEMNGRFGSGLDSGKSEDRVADFFGDVEALRAKVPGPNAVLDVERPTPDAMLLTAQTLRVVSEPPQPKALERDPNAPPRYLLRAWGDASASSVDKTIQADIITYDSQSSLLYAYGEDGRDIVIAQQDHIGQAPTLAPGRTWSYNLKTSESQLADPKSIAFLDAKTGYRPAPETPITEKVKPRIPPRKAFINRSNSIERKGYTGQ